MKTTASKEAREAAADILEANGGSPQQVLEIRAGERDDWQIVQRCVRFQLEERERCAKALEATEGALDDICCRQTRADAAAAIRQQGEEQ